MWIPMCSFILPHLYIVQCHIIQRFQMVIDGYIGQADIFGADIQYGADI